MARLKKRYFYVEIPEVSVFGMCSLADIVAETTSETWMKGHSLKEIKPYLLENKATVLELNNQSYNETFKK